MSLFLKLFKFDLSTVIENDKGSKKLAFPLSLPKPKKKILVDNLEDQPVALTKEQLIERKKSLEILRVKMFLKRMVSSSKIAKLSRPL